MNSGLDTDFYQEIAIFSAPKKESPVGVMPEGKKTKIAEGLWVCGAGEKLKKHLKEQKKSLRVPPDRRESVKTKSKKSTLKTKKNDTSI